MSTSALAPRVRRERLRRSSVQLEDCLAPVADALAEVEALLREAASAGPRLTAELTQHTLDGGGKRVRPALTLLWAEALGGAGRKAVGLAAAVETVHLASLIHDDVVDDAETRRGRKAGNRIWGNKASVLVADNLLARVFSALAKAGEVKALATLSVAVERMSDAELMQLEKLGDVAITREQCLAVARGKTAELMAAACSLGPGAAGAGEEQERAAATYGIELGLAFQIADDILDLTADEKRLGKPTGSDVGSGRLTLPIVEALSSGSKHADRLRELLSDGAYTDARVSEVAKIVEKAGGLAVAREVALSHAAAARNAISVLPQRAGPARSALWDLADYVVTRPR